MLPEQSIIESKLSETVKSYRLTAWDILAECSPRFIENVNEIKGLYLPPMQRQFVWGSDKAEQLIKDIIETPENSLKYLGIIQGNITTDGRHNIFELIEGQQRLITLYLWYMSAFHWMSQNSEEDYDMIEPQLLNTRFRFVRPSFAGNQVTLNSDSDLSGSLDAISVIDPEEQPNITHKKIKEVFKFFVSWWDTNPQEHPDSYVKDKLQESSAFLFVVAPRFTSPQRFVDQSKNVTLKLYDKLIANMMEQQPETYKNDVAANIELAYLKSSVADHFDKEQNPKFVEIAEKWELDISDLRTARRSIAEVKIGKDFADKDNNAEETIFASLADTLLITSDRIPYYTRKPVKGTAMENYELVAQNATDSIGMGFVHSRHRDSNHEGTSKINMFSKTLTVKNDVSIEQLAKHLVFEPTPVKERLERINKMLGNIHDNYINYHPLLTEHETNLGYMFPEKDIQNVIGTLAYYKETNPNLIEYVFESIFFMQAWFNILDFNELRKDTSQKWETLMTSMIEKSGRRKWEPEHGERIMHISKLIIAETLSTDFETPTPIEKMQYYILNGDTKETEGKKVDYILHDSFKAVNKINEQNELAAFADFSWKANLQDYNKILKTSQLFIWIANNHPEIFYNEKIFQIMKANKIEQNETNIWVPSKTKPFYKDAPTTEPAFWLFEPSNVPFISAPGQAIFMTIPLTNIDVLRMGEEGIFSGKLGCFTEPENIIYDDSVTAYNPKVIAALTSIATKSHEEGYRSESKYKNVADQLFLQTTKTVFDYTQHKQEETNMQNP